MYNDKNVSPSETVVGTQYSQRLIIMLQRWWRIENNIDFVVGISTIDRENTEMNP